MNQSDYKPNLLEFSDKAMPIIEEELLKDYKKTITEKLCPAKCRGMIFILYTNNTVQCITCKKISKMEELLSEY